MVHIDCKGMAFGEYFKKKRKVDTEEKDIEEQTY